VKRSPLQRKTALKAATSEMRRTRSRRRYPTEAERDAWQELRALVYARAGGRCERCGEPIHVTRFEAHHRRLRSQGGLDEPTNVVALDAVCHHVEVHGQPARAVEEGMIVPSWASPRTTPIRVVRDGVTWVRYLTMDGTYGDRP